MPLRALDSQDPVPASAARPPAGSPGVALRRPAPALWLVRHGESTWNIAGLAQGHNDQAELTSRGLSQAAEAAGRFRGGAVGAIYSSDLRRARQTAAVFGRVLGLRVRADTRLRERSLGALEGSPSAAIGPGATGLDAGQVIDPDARPAGGESVRDLYARAAAFCQALAILRTCSHGNPRRVYNQLTDSDGDVVIIAHGGTVRVLEAYLHGIPVDAMSWKAVANATVVHIPDFRAQLPTPDRLALGNAMITITRSLPGEDR
jgi:broad specificity phosphatase PhoE